MSGGKSNGHVPPRVTVAYLHSNDLSASFHESLLALVMYDGSTAGYLMHENGKIDVRCGTDGLVAGRNDTVARFLDGTGDWLFWIDSDMGFAADSLERLLAVADAKDRPIVGGLCFASKEFAGDGMGGYRVRPRPTIFNWTQHKGKRVFLGVNHYQVNRLLRCDATGSAFVLIHRSVLEKIRGEYGASWYERARAADGTLMGEDISFCMRAGSLGFPVHVHTGIRASHHKPWWVGEFDFWEAYQAPPAGTETAVLVPVLHRPHNAEPFMRSLRASSGLAIAYAICDEDDTETREAWIDAGAHIVTSPQSTFAVKINEGYRATTQPWLFLAGDDVRFRPGWLDHAQHVAQVEGAAVVGTNDLLNPRVLNGTHGTHLLVSRDYVADQGASWDGPGIVCHEGYGHWFVDDEIVTAAKQRGVWGMALASVVEHFHPLAGKAPDDEVYQMGQSHAQKDRNRFEKRLRESVRTRQKVAVG